MSTLTDLPPEGTLRVWHIPQIPGQPFIVPVSTVEEGRKVQGILADYDLFQWDNNIKPDYVNVNGLERVEDGEWREVDEEADDER